MTVGIVYPEIKNAVVTVRRGKFRVEGEYDSVRVPDEVLRSVAFIGDVTQEDSTGVSGDLLATGFFVSFPFHSPELAEYRMAYFVTAAHVAKEFSDRPIQIIVNRHGGGVTRIRSTLSDSWWVHPTDRAADVVVLPIFQQPDADIRGVSVKTFVTPEDFRKKRLGVGDEIFTTGLFTEAPGQSRTMPIVRHGNLAMLPEEQIQTDMGYADAYLVEARSIGGLSGSPVFVKLDTGDTSRTDVRLLGVMQGHWDIREAEINAPSIIHDRKRGVNLGIAVVTPASKIVEIIESPRAKEVLMALETDLTRKAKHGVPGSDLANKKGEKESDFTREDFEAALKKATRKIGNRSS